MMFPEIPAACDAPSVAPATVRQGYYDRFGGIARLYGNDGLLRLQASSIAVIGVGGVGSWSAEALARSGVGRLVLIDMDDICITNTNRQVHALDGHYGRPKIEALAERLRAINPDIVIDERFDFITPGNIAAHIDDSLDAVVDAIDSVKPKTALLAHCRRHKIAVVTVGGAGGQIDPVQVQVADLSKTYQDPLLASVRRRLRSEFGFPADGKGKFGIESVFSSEPVKFPAACDTTAGSATRLDCSGGLGASTCVTATFGMIAASRAIQRVLTRKTAVAT